MADPTRPTRIRYLVLGLTTLVAVTLYVDRFCMGFVAPYVRENLGLSNRQIAFVLDAFFYTYAIGQIPCGWLSDRFGPRLMLALYLALWSSLTGLMGLAQSVGVLVAFRLGCGLFEAGAYPACAGLIRRWIPHQQRGLASGVVSIGGRLGGAIVPALTAYLMVSFVPPSVSSAFTAEDILDARGFSAIAIPLEQERNEPRLLDVIAPRVRATLSAEVCAIIDPKSDAVRLPAPQAAVLAAAFDKLLSWPDLIDSEELRRFADKIQPEAVRLGTRYEPLSTEELARRNRLVLEAAFPEGLRKVYGEGWRPALGIYGSFGVVLALVFWLLVRDSPAQHPLANDAEVRLVQQDDPGRSDGAPVPAQVLWHGMLTSRSLWLSAAVQFGTNFGWVSLGNLLPLYLQQVHQVPVTSSGWMVTLPFLVSLPMLIVGGWWTDRMTRRFGGRWGRALPLVCTRFAAAGALGACIWLDSPWPITMALCVFALASDLGLPAIWAYCLDVGGPSVGQVLGWGNMWGNLGAAASTTTLVFIQGQFGWQAVFATSAGVFLLIGVAAFGIDATQPIVPRPLPEKEE